MPLELTPRQWRAIAAVYHLYAASGGDAASSCGAVQPAEAEAAQWAEGVLPLLQRAFPAEALAAAGRRHGQHGDNGRHGRRTERWRQLVPSALDAFLAELLLPPSSPSSRGAAAPALTANERTLLRLLNKEQRLADRFCQRHAALLGRVRRGGQALLRWAAEDASDDEEASFGARADRSSGGGAEASFPARAEASARRAGKRGREPGGEELAGAMSPATSAAPEEEVMQGAAANTTTAVNRPTTARKPPSPLPAPAAMISLTCAGCGEEGGEMFQCRHCHSLRHEACDGPRLDSEIGLCVACSHELGLSSSGSLRSSTSTEEREALSEDDTSSLSGFIVRSSEASESASASSSSSSTSP
ncbi:uncharacterized protein Tco025E_06020 [Trypanosoma conorhini]|uniref:Uncharacterized protein n=1 Tax=Trypanosoma conorhini TaxID=83891 RepID=A0A422P8A5_9TRYP|nr:uncharacterized protein Tco025E_06020 [Trypanosoma conorhini]RNF13937.1 hypothetical protein Tco025E_06020 [Trypanosoma conorhini]